MNIKYKYYYKCKYFYYERILSNKNKSYNLKDGNRYKVEIFMVN